jgi:hypothetical protein
MSQSFQIVMMEMFVLSILATQHGQELIHKVWDAFTLQTLQIAIQTTFVTVGVAMQQQVVSKVLFLFREPTTLVSDTIVILWMEINLFVWHLNLATASLPIFAWFHIVMELLVIISTKQISMDQPLFRTVVQVCLWLVVQLLLDLHLVWLILAIKPLELALWLQTAVAQTILNVTMEMVAQSIIATLQLEYAIIKTLIVILISQTELVLWTLVIQQPTQQDMQFILEMDKTFSLCWTLLEILLQEMQTELVINWHVMLDNQALILVLRQEITVILATELQQLVLFLLVKTLFVNQLDNQEHGQMEIFNQVVMSQSFQTVMMEMFVLSILATQHGQEQTHKVWDASTPQTLQIAIQTTSVTIGVAMQQQVASPLFFLLHQTTLVSNIIVILSKEINKFALLNKIVLKDQTNVLWIIVMALPIPVRMYQLRVAHTVHLNQWQMLVEIVSLINVVHHQLAILIASFTLAIQPPEIASKTTLVNVFKIATVMTTLVVPSINVSITLVKPLQSIVTLFFQTDNVL